MARVTVEDCIRKISNRFDLVLFAASRARQISSGMPLRIERDSDRNPVVALREIADGEVTQDEMEEKMVEQFSTIREEEAVESLEITSAMEEEIGAKVAEGHKISEADMLAVMEGKNNPESDAESSDAAASEAAASETTTSETAIPEQNISEEEPKESAS